MGTTFTVGALALAGAPPLSLWWTKEAVLAATPEGSGALVVVGEVAAVLAAVYATRALWFVWRPARGLVRPQRPTPRATGAAPGPARRAQRRPRRRRGGDRARPPRGTPARSWRPGPSSSAAMAATWVLHHRPVGQREAWGPALARAARGWWGLDAATRAVAVRPVLALATVLDRADAGIDRGVHAVAGGLVAAAVGVDRRGEAGLRASVAGVGRGARRLGDLARRPQSGQLHQYYAQALTALGVLGALAAVLVVAGVR